MKSLVLKQDKNREVILECYEDSISIIENYTGEFSNQTNKHFSQTNIDKKNIGKIIYNSNNIINKKQYNYRLLIFGIIISIIGVLFLFVKEAQTLSLLIILGLIFLVIGLMPNKDPDIQKGEFKIFNYNNIELFSTNIYLTCEQVNNIICTIKETQEILNKQM